MRPSREQGASTADFGKRTVEHDTKRVGSVEDSETVARFVEDLRAFIHAGRYPDIRNVELARMVLKHLGVVEIREDREDPFPKSLKTKLMKRFKGCVGCGAVEGGKSRHTPTMELHHVVSRSHGGQSTQENALLVCRDCHVSIHA